MNSLFKSFAANWKTNTCAVISFLMGVPALVTAINNVSHHQPADWAGAILGTVLAAGFAVSKDSSNHSTVAQVEAATVKADAAQSPVQK